jgi:hypothetical protein
MFEEQDPIFNQAKISSVKTELESFCRNEIEKLRRELLGDISQQVSITREKLESSKSAETTAIAETPNPKSPEFNFIFDVCLNGEPRQFAMVAELLEPLED